MKYTLSFARASQQIVQVEIEMVVRTQSDRFSLPRWRPGRYESQTYARLVTGFFARTPAGDPCELLPIDSHTWELHGRPGETVILRYLFYANQPDAGGSYVNDQIIYLNPINLLLAREGEFDQPCNLHLNLPEGCLIGGLNGPGPDFSFASYHELVDSPFFAAPAPFLRAFSFSVNGLSVHMWFLGEGEIPEEQLKADLAPVSAAQGQLFGGFVRPEFHYLVLLLPNRFRHGVEHTGSTVLAMGPGTELTEPGMYRSFLELCSHEFFHTWNVKTLRPADLFPYDYSKEQYSQLHYITEGITTYYGDLMVWKAGRWDLLQWLQSINGELSMHYTMGGRFYTSLESASFMSWVNGYHKLGFPNRRISFYTKGYLVAMLLDTLLRKQTDHAANLDVLMRTFYHEVVAEGRGYTRDDFKGAAERLLGESLDDFFRMYISGVTELLPALVEMAEFYGLDINLFPPDNAAEALFGITFSFTGGKITVENVQPDSPGEAAGVLPGDEVLTANGFHTDEMDAQGWENLLATETGIHFSVWRFGRRAAVTLERNDSWQWLIPFVSPKANADARQLENRRKWQQLG